MNLRLDHVDVYAVTNNMFLEQFHFLSESGNIVQYLTNHLVLRLFGDL